ncbi:MAG TPA: BamA/TamA family outer membrane protein, partial [Candidatus Omnitrophota bacterium]|nr:BamA/TamA family outer membrane protein [Candidatus Omnitrophota bacterium]
EEARLKLRPGFRYDRVDGAVPAMGVAFQSERDPDPYVYAIASYATGRDRFLGEAGFEAPIGDPTWLRAGADAYRRTATEDAWVVGDLENTIFALFARTDYRDWYEATGWDGHVTVEPGRDVGITGSVRVQNESSLPTRVRFSLFGRHHRFRPNPPVQSGDEGLLSVSLRLGPERLPTAGGTQGTAAYERAGGPMGRDFDYGRLRANVRTLHRFSKRSLLRARAIGGSTREGILPPQKIWHVGGIGTLRGHDYKAFSGDQFFVANAEYLVKVRKQFFPFAFLDWGAAWFGRENLGRQQPGFDGGAGFLVGENGLALTVARDLRRSDAPFRFGVRLGASF